MLNALVFYNILFLVIIAVTASKSNTNECLKRDYGNGGTVCVCNDNHCDKAPQVGKISPNTFVTITSDKSGRRFKKDIHNFKNLPFKENVFDECIQEIPVEYQTCTPTTIKESKLCSGDSQQILKEGGTINPNKSNKRIIIDRSRCYQRIIGFGGAISDATAINIKSLSPILQEYIMKSIYSKEGLEYNMGRITMGGTDFSPRLYTYMDTDEQDVDCVDLTLNNFNLVNEDLDYKIPVILEANRLNPNINYFASAWTAPKAFKENKQYSGTVGFLKKGLYQLWADYFVKFLCAYKDKGVNFWGITTGNEPFVCMMGVPGIPGVFWQPEDQGKWIRENLALSLIESGFEHVNIIAIDDQRPFLHYAVPLVFANGTSKFIAGVGIHWYLNDDENVYYMDEFHDQYPEKFLIGSEACAGDFANNISLGAWDRAERYAKDIVQNLNHWASGWVDWNIVLDTNGGPRAAGPVDAVIIVNETYEEFYKQPTFYAMGHFSKYIPRDSVRIYSTQCKSGSNTDLVAFLKPDGSIAIVFVNRSNKTIKKHFMDNEKGEFELTINPHSITTIIYH